MSHDISIEAMEQYRGLKRDALVDFYQGLWRGMDMVEDAPRAERYTRLNEYLQTFAPRLGEVAGAIDATALDPPVQEGVSAAAIDDWVDRLIDQTPGTPDAEEESFLRLALVSTLEPDIARAVKDAAPLKENSPAQGTCPRCGAPAALGILRDEGQAHGGSRELWCSLCDTAWRYPRIKCARCGNEHQEELGYRFAEGDSAHRIYTCAACAGTLKVVSEAELGRICDPRVEEVVLEDLLDAVIGDVQ